MTNNFIFFILYLARQPPVSLASSFTRFLDHTQRRTTLGKTPLDEWSALRRDLYLTTHNTHNIQTSMPPVGFESLIPASERPQTHALDRANARYTATKWDIPLAERAVQRPCDLTRVYCKKDITPLYDFDVFWRIHHAPFFTSLCINQQCTLSC